MHRTTISQQWATVGNDDESPSLQLVIQFPLPRIVVLRVIVVINVRENCGCVRIFRWLLELPISDIPYSIENKFLQGGLWTISSFLACIGNAIAAVFRQSWGPVELDLSPWDSPKGLCNLGWVPGIGYWGHTTCQRYLTCRGSKSILTRTFLHKPSEILNGEYRNKHVRNLIKSAKSC